MLRASNHFHERSGLQIHGARPQRLLPPFLPRPPRSGANQHPPSAGSAPIIHRAGPSPTTFAGALSLNSGAWLGWRDGVSEDGGAFPARGFPGEGLRLAGALSGPGEAEDREDPGL